MDTFGDSEKPLVRWTIGPVAPLGYDCLDESIRCWRLAYGDLCDLVICHNGPVDFGRLAATGVSLHAQRGDELPGMSRPPNCAAGGKYRWATMGAWKLYPPRLRPGAHEIFLDNDVVVRRRIPEIDAFLAQRDFLLGLPGTDREKWACWGYGRLAKLGRAPVRNSGLFGLHPWFDLAAALPTHLLGHTWKEYLDEQGLIGIALQDRSLILIDRGKVGFTIKDGINRSVIHFLSLNQQKEWHPYWSWYKSVHGSE
jgi:hypothetical protein